MKKADRQKVFDKYGGRCAYCGCELLKGWHVDEQEPVRRNWKTEYDPIKQKYVRRIIGAVNPENFNIDNQFPACASCNINKHSDTLEQFRKNIAAYMKHLNEVSTQYKLAKRYGLVQETGIEVKFYFETVFDNN
jgi:5-methylcytosine-specific restriction endonuclease McrA